MLYHHSNLVADCSSVQHYVHSTPTLAPSSYSSQWQLINLAQCSSQCSSFLLSSSARSQSNQMTAMKASFYFRKYCIVCSVAQQFCLCSLLRLIWWLFHSTFLWRIFYILFLFFNDLTITMNICPLYEAMEVLKMVNGFPGNLLR